MPHLVLACGFPWLQKARGQSDSFRRNMPRFADPGHDFLYELVSLGMRDCSQAVVVDNNRGSSALPQLCSNFLNPLQSNYSIGASRDLSKHLLRWKKPETQFTVSLALSQLYFCDLGRGHCVKKCASVHVKLVCSLNTCTFSNKHDTASIVEFEKICLVIPIKIVPIFILWCRLTGIDTFIIIISSWAAGWSSDRFVPVPD